MEPTIKKIRLCKPYLVHPETKQIYAQYGVMVSWPDGTRKSFDSEEQAKAFIEGRKVDPLNIQLEVPAGFKTALELTRQQNKPPEEKTTEEQEEFDVWLMECDKDKRVAVIKAIRTLTALGLRESKELVDKIPIAVKKQIDKNEAQTLAADLILAGAKVEIK